MRRVYSIPLVVAAWLSAFPATAGVEMVVPVPPPSPPAGITPGAPLEGSLIRLALTVTDEKALDDLDWTASAYTGLPGNPLPGATSDTVIAVLDSGSATHLLAYPDATALGVSGSVLSGNTLPIGGVGGSSTVDISMPLGVFVHGLQDLDGNLAISPDLVVGQGNFAAGVNTEANHTGGVALPTIVGAPLFAYFGAVVRNSQRYIITWEGERVSSASVDFFFDPTDPSLPVFPHRFSIEPGPATPLQVAFFPDISAFPVLNVPAAPSSIGSGLTGSLFFLTTPVTVRSAATSTTARMMFDTGAQATILSELVAEERLGLDLANPDFEVEVRGAGGSRQAPGFYLRELAIAATGGGLVWSNVPVVVLNTASPESGILEGILGVNLFGDRDFMVNSVAQFPFVGVSAPMVEPVLEVVGLSNPSQDVWQVEWRSEPAVPRVALQVADGNDLVLGAWTSIATGSLGSIEGTISITGAPPWRAFRFVGE